MHEPVDSKHDRYDDELDGNDTDGYDDLCKGGDCGAGVRRA